MNGRIRQPGERHGGLVILERIVPPEKKHSKLLCQCDCGEKILIDQTNFRKQNSCKKCAIKKHTKHGMNNTPIYEAWSHMKQRCLNSSDKNFHHYGGRGISICEEWHEFLPFYEWSITNGYKEGLSLDRIDNNGNYEPGNCRWTDRITQQNNRRNSIYLTVDGITLPCAEWARRTGIPKNTLRGRILLGWNPKDIISIPAVKGGHLREQRNINNA